MNIFKSNIFILFVLIVFLRLLGFEPIFLLLIPIVFLTLKLLGFDYYILLKLKILKERLKLLYLRKRKKQLLGLINSIQKNQK